MDGFGRGGSADIRLTMPYFAMYSIYFFLNTLCHYSLRKTGLVASRAGISIDRPAFSRWRTTNCSRACQTCFLSFAEVIRHAVIITIHQYKNCVHRSLFSPEKEETIRFSRLPYDRPANLLGKLGLFFPTSLYGGYCECVQKPTPL